MKYFYGRLQSKDLYAIFQWLLQSRRRCLQLQQRTVYAGARHRYVDSIKIGLRKNGYEDVNFIK